MNSLRSRSIVNAVLQSLSWENTGDSPLSVPQVKSWAKVAHDEQEDDTLISALIDEVVDLVEQSYNFTIRDKTVTATFERFGSRIILPMSPVKTIESVKIIDDSETLYEQGEDYYFNGNTLHFTRSVIEKYRYLEIIYTAGWDAVPGGIILGLKKAILSAYEDRQDVAGMSVELMPGHSKSLFKKYRRF